MPLVLRHPQTGREIRVASERAVPYFPGYEVVAAEPFPVPADDAPKDEQPDEGEQPIDTNKEQDN